MPKRDTRPEERIAYFATCVNGDFRPEFDETVTWARDVRGVDYVWTDRLGWLPAFVGPQREFMVERATWFRGRGTTESKLLRGEDGARCCLGFLGRACGIADRDMLGVGAPRCVIIWEGDAIVKHKWPWGIMQIEMPGFFSEQTNVASVLMETNDDNSDMFPISDEERERQLSELFQTIGIRPIFV